MARTSWGSRVGAILAVMGSAVGLGNFLRFPGQAAKYGGGAFIIPYLVAFVLVGLPLAWVEWALGRYGGARGHNSAPGIFRAVTGKRQASYIGMLGVLMPVMIYTYYAFVEAWCLAYAWDFMVGRFAALGKDAAAIGEYFETSVGAAANGQVFSGPGSRMLIFLGICFVLNFVLIYRGVTHGIEKFCNIAMPLLVVCGVIVLVRVLTLPPNPAHPGQSVINGLGYLFNPSGPDRSVWQALARPEVWLAATGQIFFSMSVGFGLILTYASYLKPDDDVALSSLTAAAGNGFCEVALGGMIAIPAAFVFLGPSVIASPPGTFGMGFVTLSTLLIVQDSLGSRDLGVATSSHQFARTLGGTLGVGVCGGLVTSRLLNRLETVDVSLPQDLMIQLKESMENLFRPEFQATGGVDHFCAGISGIDNLLCAGMFPARSGGGIIHFS